MAELQTIAAAGDVAKLALKCIIFLNKVRTAEKIAAEVHERASRLKRVLDSVREVLEAREEKGVAPHDSADTLTVNNIRECINASGRVLGQIEEKVGGFATSTTGGAPLERFRLACRHSAIKKLQTDLEARVSALQADLSLLQLADQAHTHATLGQNHETLLEILATLRGQIDEGNKLLHRMLSEQRKPSSTTVPAQDEAAKPTTDVDDADPGAIESLVECLRMAEDSHEKYTSEYAPDNRSEMFHDRVMSQQQRDSPLAPATPLSEASGQIPLSPSDLSATQVDDEDDDGEGEDTWPLPVLTRYIEGAHERATKEKEQGHFNQAEVNLQSAIRYAEMRERHYDIPFENRGLLHEEVAFLYQKQGKYGEAVAKVHQLLRESPDELSQARQHQLLAAIYFDRHQNRNGPALSNATDDAANAERYAQKAFNTRFTLLENGTPGDEEKHRHNSCTGLLVRILETRDKTVEANELTKLLTEGSSTNSESMTRISSSQAPMDSVMVESKQELFITAILEGDIERFQELMNNSEVNIEQADKQGKTPLFHAVEQSDETIVHKLLVEADVNTCNKRGLTALHHAASLGLHDMVHCLLHHDAEIDVLDKRKETPLMKAVHSDQPLVVQVLADKGANMEASNADEWSLLHFAVRLQKTSMINHLLDLTPELKDAVDTAGKTALHHCAEMELVDQATALLLHKNNVDVRAMDSVSRSALYFAATKPPTPRRESMVQILVQNGAKVDDTRPPPRWRDYASLQQFQVPRRASKIKMSRKDSVSTVATSGSVGTASTGQTKLSRIFSSRSSRKGD